MLSIKPGQNWERRSMPGAPWRPVDVVNVAGEEVELWFLDMPDAPDLERVFSTNPQQMRLAPDHGHGPEYKLVRNFD
jgi:hypothetical protein